jgi:SH3 domain protein
MKSFYRHLLLVALLCLFTTSFATAETRYVGDTLVISVRELPNDTAPRIKNIITGVAFEFLEESGDFLKVRLEDGTEGYVKSRYTTSDTPKSTIIKRLQTENAALKKQYNDLSSSLSDQESAGVNRQKALQTKLKGLQESLTQQITASTQLKKELASLNKQHTSLKNSADNVVQIISQAEKLRTENERLQIESETLLSENAVLLRTAVIKWVLTGAGILLIGWLMGKVSRNKRRYTGI